MVKLFREQLGYTYLGNLEDKPDNSNIEVPLLTQYLSARSYDRDQISKALDKLQSAANHHGQDLYHNNKAVYQLLRCGVPVKVEAGAPTVTVQVIDWQHLGQNRFYIAEEVTVFGKKEKRPEIVLYVNGIAIGVLELKNSRVFISEGIRQNRTNQEPEFIEKFFSTIQFVFAGNDSEGLQYGTIGTPEKFFLTWKEDEADNSGYKLDKYLAKMCQPSQSQPCHAVGELFIFVDECHRTQSGKLHKTMKALLPGAVFIGFTGTPLLKKDKATSLEVFGKYIHTYKFNEAVQDGVVLDLVYEARDIDQRLSSQKKIDEWFASKTKGLNDFQRAELKKKWGTMQNVLSSRSRMDKVVTDIVGDFSVKPRLNNDRGNAILVASSIYEACRYYELFQATELKGKCAVVTSYNPQSRDISTEETGANTETDKQVIYHTYETLLKDVKADPGKSRTETYEDRAKKRFVEEPAAMRLLIVVDKLLTGFDAPSCTYLYIDKSMQDHGLFQAICRVNRLDSDDKKFGFIVDYKDLFKKLVNDKGTGAIQVYTGELDYDQFEARDCDILLQDRLKKGREWLDDALEELELLCEKVEPPKGDLQHMHYFCGNPEIPDDLKTREVQRTALYKATVNLIRAYANIGDDMEAAGYGVDAVEHIQRRVDHYLKLRDIIKNAAGEKIDLKAYEADMRYLIDRYIQAEESVVISPFGDMPILEIIEKSGIAEAIGALPAGIKANKEAVAETIENNVRSHIIKNHLLDPAYFEKMSKLLEEIIKFRKENAEKYKEYLQKIADLARQVSTKQPDDLPESLNTQAKRVLYSNVGENEALALQLNDAVMDRKEDSWRGNQAKENQIKRAIFDIVRDADEVERIFAIVKQQRDY